MALALSPKSRKFSSRKHPATVPAERRMKKAQVSGLSCARSSSKRMADGSGLKAHQAPARLSSSPFPKDSVRQSRFWPKRGKDPLFPSIFTSNVHNGLILEEHLYGHSDLI